jgi:uncharacterized membrane protein
MRADVNKFVAAVLSTGVLLSLVLLIWGGILMLTHPGPHTAPGSIGHVLTGFIHLNPVATVNLGLLVLLLTPVARVIAAMLAFAIEKDRRYAIISFIVLAILAASPFIGRK